MTVNRIGYGAVQLAGPGVFWPPKDIDTAMAVLLFLLGGFTPMQSSARL